MTLGATMGFSYVEVFRVVEEEVIDPVFDLAEGEPVAPFPLEPFPPPPLRLNSRRDGERLEMNGTNMRWTPQNPQLFISVRSQCKHCACIHSNQYEINALLCTQTISIKGRVPAQLLLSICHMSAFVIRLSSITGKQAM